MSSFSRYITAFWKALQLTLRGETLQPRDEYPEFTIWMQQTIQLTDNIFTIADKHALDEPARKTLMLRIDKREIAMQTILAAVKHNVQREYPLLLASRVEHFAGAIQALNHNDCYRISQLGQTLGAYPQVQQAVQRLETHLLALPTNSNT